LALAQGRADYILIIDADDFLILSPDFKLPPLTLDCYFIQISHGGSVYTRPQLVKSSLDWTWTGALHEYIHSSQARSSTILSGVTMKYGGDGARSRDPSKYRRDAELLEAALKDDLDNSRTVFYLAQSYRDAGDYRSALKYYEKRATMGGAEQEVFTAMLQIALMQELLQEPATKWINSYYKAYLYRSRRAEPLYYLANYYRRVGDHLGSYLAARQGLHIQPPDDGLFVERWIYEYGLLFEYAMAADSLGRYQEAQAAYMRLLSVSQIPDPLRELVQMHLRATSDQLALERDKLAKKAA
jgi:hypothetical protein